MEDYNATHKCKWLLATPYNIRHYEDGRKEGVWYLESAYDGRKIWAVRFCPYCGMQLYDNPEDSEYVTISSSWTTL